MTVVITTAFSRTQVIQGQEQLLIQLAIHWYLVKKLGTKEADVEKLSTLKRFAVEFLKQKT